MPEQLQNIVQEGIKKLREVSTIEWIYCVRLEKHTIELCCIEDTRDAPFSKAIQNALLKDIPEYLRSSMVDVFSKPEIVIEDAFIKLYFLIAIGMIEFGNNCQNQSVCNFHNEH